MDWGVAQMVECLSSNPSTEKKKKQPRIFLFCEPPQINMSIKRRWCRNIHIYTNINMHIYVYTDNKRHVQCLI
jgi:hypothetical protein